MAGTNVTARAIATKAASLRVLLISRLRLPGCEPVLVVFGNRLPIWQSSADTVTFLEIVG